MGGGSSRFRRGLFLLPTPPPGFFLHPFKRVIFRSINLRILILKILRIKFQVFDAQIFSKGG